MAKIDYLNYEGLKYYRSKHSEEITALETRLTQAYSGADSALSTSLGEQIEVLRKKIPEDVYITMKVGETEVKANGQSTLELIAGDNVTLTPDAANKSITITAKDTTYPMASDSVDGLLSKEDYTTLHNLGAAYTPDNATIVANDQNQLIVNNVPATKISGVLNISQIPTTALERLYVVANKTALLALTSEQVQNGDTVKVTSYADGSETPISKMFLVVDESKLGTSDAIDAFTEYTASTYWSNIKDIPNIAYKGDLAKVATSGSYEDLANKPTIPSSTNQLTNNGAPNGNGDPYTTVSALSSAVEAINASIAGLNYAGSNTNGGVANSAAKLETGIVGSSTQPVYFNSEGVPVATTYSLNKTVPSDAVFTDTTYTLSSGTNNGTLKLTPSSGAAQDNIAVTGLKALAYKDSLSASDVGAFPLSGTREIFMVHVDVPDYEALNSIYGTEGHEDNTYYENAIKWLANYCKTNWPNKAPIMVTGNMSPNSQGWYVLHIYDPAYVQNGLPQYSSGICNNLNSIHGFGTSNYTYNHPTTYVGDLNGRAASATSADSAASASKLSTGTTGSSTQPVYFSNGVPAACSYTLSKSVPSDAKFTDTVYTHPNSGVSAGTYRSVTVNAQGHVTSGTNPTTLAGYGITDAKIASGTITLGSNSITPLTSHQSVVNGGNTASWGSSVTVGTVGGTALTFKMPSNPNTNTWRPIQVDGTDRLTDSSTKLNLKAGSNVTLSYSSGTVTINAASDDTSWKTSKADASALTSHTGNTTVHITAAERTKWNNAAAGDLRALANTWQQKQSYSASGTVESGSTSGSGAINVTSGGIWAAGGIKGNKVYNAVWNDLADCIPVDDEVELEAGRCYCFDGNHYYKSNEYLADGIIGIHSDTYGMHMGAKQGVKQMDVAVAGFVLAYVDKEYPVGTALTCTEDGMLTAMSKQDKIEYPEKIVATYWKNELEEYWGSDTQKVKVNGRRWVKVR